MWQVKYALGGGFGGTRNCDWEDTDCKNEDEAVYYAYEMACQEYESYGGMHGLFNEKDALEDDPDLTSNDLEEMWREDKENWIVYEVRNVKTKS